MKTRQHNIPSEYEESKEAERLDSESSDDSEYAPASQENSSEDNDQPHEASPSASRGTGATDKISTSEIPRPSNALLDNPIQVVFHLNPPKHALSEVFSPQQLSQLGLQSLAQVDLMSNMVTPGKLGAMLLTFPKLNNKILYVEHLGRAMGIKNMPIPLPTSKTYSRLTPRETADACDELLSTSHPDFQRHLKIFHILHYYFLMRFPVVNSLSLPSPRLYDMFFCLCHSLPYPFHVTMFKAIQNRTKRFKTQRKGKAEKFHCYAAPIMQWMAQLISESDTPGSSQPPAIDKGKRPLPGRGVQTRGGHSKRTKVEDEVFASTLCLLPAKFNKTLWIRKGSFALVEEGDREGALESGNKVTGVICQVLFGEQIRALKRSLTWPAAFEDSKMMRDSENEGINSKDSTVKTSNSGGSCSEHDDDLPPLKSNQNRRPMGFNFEESSSDEED
ncbi:hypothetical protein L7F22_036651 [Adiantum nelumboides]|nr:hypothetical protein [Adiantum nelumboides]